MPGKFYTERDIVDLVRSGQRELHLSEHDRMTDLARERAAREGLRLTGPYKIPEQAAREAASTRYARADSPGPAAGVAGEASTSSDLHARVRRAVIARLGSSVDTALLDDVIERVFRKLGH